MSNKLYVFGHQKPDTDSITSAIVLANLERALGLDATAYKLGEVNKETKYRALKEVFDIIFKDTRLEVKESFMKELERENEQREELYFKKGR